VRLVLSLLVMLPASTAIGTSFPLLVASTSRRADELGAIGSSLYAADLLGASLGAGLTAFWLPAALGVRGAYFAGVAALGVVGLAMAYRSRAATGDPTTASADVAHRRWPPMEVALLSGVSGFGVFAAQLLLHQAFGRVLDQSTFALGAVLVTTLLALALGAVAVSRLQSRVPPTVLLAVSGGIAALGFAFFPRLFTAATGGLAYVVSTGAQSSTYVPRTMLLCGLTAGPALVAAAAVLPSLFAITGGDANGDGRQAGSLAGALLAANTAGAIAGAIAAPYVLLPQLSLWPSFVVLAALYVIVAAVGGRSFRHGWAIGIILGSIVALATPWRVPPVRLAPSDSLLFTHMSGQGLVAVVERRGHRFIQTDNHYLLGGSADAVHQERQGHLPLLLHPSPRRVAFIGSATGSSASAALRHGVSDLTAVEIMPGVTHAAQAFFAESNAGVFDDPRTRVVTEDARAFLRREGQSFDVIVGDLFVPWRSETGSLYAQEHFERARARLAAGGFFWQWLPLYQLSPEELDMVMATFLDVFPNAQVYRGDFFGPYAIIALVGGRDGVPDLAQAGERALALGERGIEDRWVTHPDGPPSLYVGPLASLRDPLARVPRNTDDEPRLEFSAARNPARHAGGEDWTVAGVPFLERAASIAAGLEGHVWA
ncbi:MAG: fused MFS/spermidine synthase, partial [Polyangiales bacterium]